jgi:hypothetical protein
MGEYLRATSLHGDFQSAHEGLAVIREEYLELESEVFWGRKTRSDAVWLDRIEREAVQIAAMALRFIVDVRKATQERG